MDLKMRFVPLDGTTEILESDTPRVSFINHRSKHIELVGITDPRPAYPRAKTLSEWFYEGGRVTWAWVPGEPHGETMKKLSRQVEDRLRKDSSFLGRVIGLNLI